jgi:uncharacterized membrane protein YebE (DUF533 family)
MLKDLPSEDRLRLARFVCAFAWADLKLQDEERHYVQKLMSRLGLSSDEQSQVASWLQHPPAPEEVDPNSIPTEHRQLFLDEVRGLIASDLSITAEERETFQLLQSLFQEAE